MAPSSATILIVGIIVRNCFSLDAIAHNITTSTKNISIAPGARLDETPFRKESFNNIPRLRAQFGIQVGIINGKHASIKDFPFMVSIVYGMWLETLLCGGTIIGKKWVLTAASCLYDYHWTYFVRVRSNSTYWNKDYVDNEIKGWYSHKRYNHHTFDYDICVIELWSHFSHKYEKPIPFADSKFKYHVFTHVKVIGWGKEAQDEEPSLSLRQANMIIAPHYHCKLAYKELQKHHYPLISSRQVCATGWGQGICEQDPGGPLYHDGKIIGIASRGFPCTGHLLTLDVFTRISKFNKFIKNIMKKD